MHIFKTATFILALALPFNANAADQLKPGQWDMAVSMEMANMPKLSAEQLAQMKQLGIQMPAGGEPMHVQQCITPEQASLKQPINASQRKNGCIVKNYKHSGNTASGDIACTGEIKGNGKFEMTVNNDTSYTSKSSMKGVAKGGQPIDQAVESSGKWVKSTCDAGIAGNTKQ